MKKFLMTTTALVATAGFAAAEVSVSGSAEMGIIKPKFDADDKAFNDVSDPKAPSLRFHQDIDVNFKMSAETDGGLSISTAVDLDEAGDLGGSGHHGTSITLSGGFGNVTLGDTDGAADWATAEMSSVFPGSITDESTGMAMQEVNGLDKNSVSDGIAGYLDLDKDGKTGTAADGKYPKLDQQPEAVAKSNSQGYTGQILRYDNTVGAVGFAVSLERPDNTSADNAPSMGIALGAKFDAGPVTVGLGIQNAEITRTGYNRKGNLTDGFATADTHRFSETPDATNPNRVITEKALKGKRSRTILSASGELSGIKYAVLYSMGKDAQFYQGANNDNEDSNALNDDAYNSVKTRQLQVGVAYSADDFTVAVGMYQANKKDYAQLRNDSGTSAVAKINKKSSGNAIGVSYNLGGGAKMLFGYNSEKKYSLGLSMSF